MLKWHFFEKFSRIFLEDTWKISYLCRRKSKFYHNQFKQNEEKSHQAMFIQSSGDADEDIASGYVLNSRDSDCVNAS